jgi:hypothetical protein
MTAPALIGHNGGPKLRKGRKLTPSQLRALRGMRDHGNSAHGLSGNSQFGGWNNTIVWIRKECLGFWSEADKAEFITERGRRCLDAGRLVE